MHKTVKTIIFMFCCNVLVASHPAQSLLPLCRPQQGNGVESIFICTIDSDQFLDFDEIRSFTASRNDKFDISIKCIYGGKIRLPWPFFAKNLVRLRVSDCLIEGFLSERSMPQIFPNELKHVELLNSKIKVNIKDLHSSIVNLSTMSKDYDCGHTNAEVSKIRNTEYVFPPFSGSMEDLLLMEELMSPSTLENILSHNSMCRYKNLRYLEESGSRDFSKFHMKLMETSQYPSLEQYSLRNNSFTSVPTELENFRSSFLPKLSVLDLAHNRINKINFVFSPRMKSDLLIDLRGNSIHQLSQTQLNEIFKASRVILDLRENPLECTCELFQYGHYLLKRANSAIADDIYKGITCSFRGSENTLYHVYDREVHHLCSV